MFCRIHEGFSLFGGYILSSRYLDPKNALAFKKIFGEEKHKRIPIEFLNAALNLSGDDLIIDLDFLPTIQVPEILGKKESRIDVLVRDQRGTKYIVEMQVLKVAWFERRAQFYPTRVHSGSLSEGAGYGELNKVVFLSIIDYIIFPNKTQYKSKHIIFDEVTHENDLRDFSFTFVELPKFTKENYEELSSEEKWYYFFKHATEPQAYERICAEDSVLQEAYTILDRLSWTGLELMAYEEIVLDLMDDRAKLAAAQNEGKAKGRTEGEAKGKAEGKKQIAKALLAEGCSIDVIAAAAQMSKGELLKLLESEAS